MSLNKSVACLQRTFLPSSFCLNILVKVVGADAKKTVQLFGTTQLIESFKTSWFIQSTKFQKVQVKIFLLILPKT